MARTSQTRQVTAHKVGIKVPDTALERVLVILSRYREASIAVVAIVLVAYFQLASNGAFLSPQELSVVLRDTGRFGLIAVAEVMLMITGEIDLSVGSTFSLAPYVMVLMTISWGVPLAVSALAGLLLGLLIGAFGVDSAAQQPVHFGDQSLSFGEGKSLGHSAEIKRRIPGSIRSGCAGHQTPRE